ncbi:hypothetical protein GH714_012390 [Hevea brasiliensis]|uniref:Uncharacterized protein n=1 Tax=Hevea brasiliensis TaxID=3981 RepID=A0A6A6MYI3_HEVBR|nr:hypothetical protein GH714_012390 [Hevea brasiliensis]
MIWLQLTTSVQKPGSRLRETSQAVLCCSVTSVLDFCLTKVEHRTCEICGSIARNVASPNEVELVEQWNEVNEIAVAAAAPSVHTTETRNFWQGIDS